MKKLRIKNMQSLTDCSHTINLNTVDGLEQVHINMATGEITYGPDACVDMTLLRESLAEQGAELEEDPHSS